MIMQSWDTLSLCRLHYQSCTHEFLLWLTVQWLQFQSLQQLLLQGILPGKHGTNTRQIPVANFTMGEMCNWKWNDTICWPL